MHAAFGAVPGSRFLRAGRLSYVAQMGDSMTSVEQIRSERWQRVFAEVGRLVGGKVVRAERQPRWRPAWFLEVERDSEIVAVYFRGGREMGEGKYDIRYEYRVMRVLEEHEIPVPHIYGFCEDPGGIVMARAPGRANLATARDDDERRAVLDHYVEILARMHRIDVAAFEAIGLTRPSGARQIGLDDLPVWEKAYRQSKSRPEPLIELVLLWLKRNVPMHRTRTTFVTGDAAQFLFDDGGVTAVLDFELSHLGDPLGDLAAFRARDVSEPLGDISRAYERYAEITGEELDLPTIRFHSIRFALNTPLAVAPLCAQPFPGLNLPQYLSWNLVYGRMALESIAEIEGIDLEGPVLPATSESRHAALYDQLVSLLDAGSGDYANQTALRLAQFAREIDRCGDEVERDDRARVAAVVGKPVADWRAADGELERMVLADDRADDADLIRCIHRRTTLQELLLRPAMRELPNLQFQPIRRTR
jgi:hypothetical protein